MAVREGGSVADDAGAGSPGRMASDDRAASAAASVRGASPEAEDDDDGGERPAPTARLMENMPCVDLSGVRDRAAVIGLRLRNVAAVLVPQDIPDLLSGADCRNVAAIIPVPPGIRVETRVGQAELAGDTLAAGDAHTILAIIGQAIVTGSVPAIGYRGVVLVGQIVLPREAQGLLGCKIISQTGQVVYYDAGATPRVFLEDTHFSKAFFDLIPQPITLVLVGDCSFAADVTPEVLRAKVHSVVLVGDARVEDAALRPMLQYLATTLAGTISVGVAEPEAADE